ncbi:50S ribosomal protein L25/general stress protein Ctc [Brevibacterium otitidis]|uniref:Large ribosomal subunit protein bL25 n=1 Tax=Brevibacterium otitidis TaxID=53364 RepID=A0ABV5WYN4_9MICO|nr:50S ribosomal protein L25/general stress protein Ctc [Brevibacterium otitidis]
MADFKLIAERRDDFGKGAARRLRREDKIPAVLYGHGEDPVHLTLDGHATMMAMKMPNALLEIESPDGAKNRLAIARDIQRHPVTHNIEHLDLIIVKRGEKIEVEVPVVIEGEAAPGTVVSVDNQLIRLLAEATSLPESVEISIEGRGVGEHIYAGDVAVPEGSELVDDPELLMVNISAELSEEQLEAELESDAVDEEVAAATGAPAADEAEAGGEEAAGEEE